MVEQVICMIYVDDCILFSKEDKYIDDLNDKMFENNLNSNINIKVLMANLVFILLIMVLVMTIISSSQRLATSTAF